MTREIDFVRDVVIEYVHSQFCHKDTKNRVYFGFRGVGMGDIDGMLDDIFSGCVPGTMVVVHVWGGSNNVRRVFIGTFEEEVKF